MPIFANIEDGIVVDIIVAELSYLNRVPGNWIETDYEQRTSVTTEARIASRSPAARRKHYAGVGYTYDKVRDVFLPPRKFKSWVLDESMCQWRAPKSPPVGVTAPRWDEKLGDWVERST